MDILKSALKSLIILLLTSFITFISACNKKDHTIQGYVEGEYLYLSSAKSGTLNQLLINRGEQVKVGQPAFVLDSQPEISKLEQAKEKITEAKANINQIQATISFDQLSYERQLTLVGKKVNAQQQLDLAQRDIAVSKANLQAAEANLVAAKAAYAQAQWAYSQKAIAIPADSQVIDTYYLPGEFVPAGTPVAALLQPSQIYVIFFVPESILSEIRLGQAITVNCDSCQSTSAHISYISPTAEYTPPVIYSQNTRDNLVYRIEADFTADNAANFHPGQPIDVSLQP